MTEEDKLKVINLLMLLQISVYAADETTTIPWFNKQKTKSVLNTFLDLIIKEHGHVIKSFWDIPEMDMVEVTKVLSNFGKAAGSLQYYDLVDVTKLINDYKNKNL
jgi:hypothetical protein